MWDSVVGGSVPRFSRALRVLEMRRNRTLRAMFHPARSDILLRLLQVCFNLCLRLFKGLFGSHFAYQEGIDS